LVENPWLVPSIVILSIAAILSVLCSFGAYKVYYRWRKSLAAWAMMICCTTLAISLGGLSIYSRLPNEPLNHRQFASFLAIVLIAIAMLSLLVALINLYLGLHGGDWKQFRRNMFKLNSR
jgi:hypothetical protein